MDKEKEEKGEKNQEEEGEETAREMEQVSGCFVCG